MKSDPAIGQEIDGYRIEAVLGRGGMGVVYKAEDVALSREVAIKVIDPALTRNESFLHRFHSEARALARVRSNHIVTIHALRKTRLGLCIVMEYVDGGTLADLIEKGPLSIDQSLDLTRQILLAFRDAHGVGVIHRDIKPSNIMVASDESVKVTDFGLAKVHNPTTDSTVTQGIAGTLYYMSPEQVKGLRNVDNRSDLYSIGMTLYEMVTGRLPFDRTESQFTILKMIAEEKLAPPTAYRKDLPRSLSKLISRALQKDPARRFESADEMLTAVDALREEPSSNGTRERRPFVSAVAAAVTIAILGFGAYAIAPMISQMAADVGVLASDDSARPTADLREPDPQMLESQSPEPPATTSEGATAQADDDAADPAGPFSESGPDDGPMAEFDEPAPELDGTKPVNPSPAGNQDRFQAPQNQETRASGDGGRPAETERVSRVGRLDVRSRPEVADVFVDGERIGTASGIISGVAAGRRMVTLRLPGYEEYSTRVEIQEGKTYHIEVELERLTGILRVRAVPWAEVEIDGIGTIPEVSAAWMSRVVPVGSNTVTAIHPSFGRCTVPVSVASEGPNDVFVNYHETVGVPVTAFDSEGQGLIAEILLDGESTGMWTPAEVKLTVGCSYALDVRKEGYDHSGRPLAVRRMANESQPVRFTLTAVTQ